MWSVIGYILLALLGLLLLILLMPLYVRLRYREELVVCVHVLGIPVYRYSSAKPPKQQEQKTDKPVKKKTTEKPTMLNDLSVKLKTEGVRAVVDEIASLARIVSGAARRVFRAVTVDRLQMELVIASADAAATAQDTGKVCAVLYPALTTVQSVIRIRKRAVTVVPDYLGEKGRVTADVLIHAVPIRLVWAALCALIAYMAFQSRKSTNTGEDAKNG